MKKTTVARARSNNKSEAIADAAAADIEKLEQECKAKLESLEEDDKKIANAVVAHYRQMIEDRKWKARIYHPKKYRENLTISGDDANPLKIVHELVVTRVGAK